MDNTTRNILIATAVLIIAGLVALFVALRGGSNNTAAVNDANLCPADTFICPDGSTVGRVAPSCQFATCTNVANSPAARYKD